MYSLKELNNGLRIVCHDMKDRDSVALGIIIGVGGRYEEDQIKGAAHFLEHILFKGSEKYSCDDIKMKIEGVGGNLNAFTSEELTCYYAKIPSKHIKRTFDILADMVLAPAIPKREVEKERGVILEEIKMYHDLPQYYVMELLDQLMWPDHPLGKSIAGTDESVSRISKSELKQFHKKHYTPANMVIAFCGNIDIEEVAKLVEQKFGKVKIEQKSPYTPFSSQQQSPRTLFHQKEIEQMHVALGMHGVNEQSPDKYLMTLLHIIMGGNMSSRLFHEVREKRGLAYSIASSVKMMKDTGMFMVRAGVDNTKVTEAIRVVLRELKRIRTSGASEDEFKRAKEYYLGQVLLGLEDTMDHMLWLGGSLITQNKVRTIQDVVKHIKAIKIGDIKRLARDIYQPNQYNLAIVGPLKDEQMREINAMMGIKEKISSAPRMN